MARPFTSGSYVLCLPLGHPYDLDLHDKQPCTSLSHHTPSNICSISLYLFRAKNLKKTVYNSSSHFFPSPCFHQFATNCLCLISMASLQFNGQSPLFILLDFPTALNMMGYSLPFDTFSFLDPVALLFPSSPYLVFLLWPSQLWPWSSDPHISIYPSLLGDPIYFYHFSHHQWVLIELEARSPESTFWPCAAPPSFRPGRPTTRRPGLPGRLDMSWTLPGEMGLTTSPWNHLSPGVLYIHEKWAKERGT